jgi:hypothetical protein
MKMQLMWMWEKFKNKFFLKFLNPYGIEPYGCFPVQAEGHLATGEFYYFRARGINWRLEICESEKEWWSHKILYTRGGTYGEHFDAGTMPTYEVIKRVNQVIKQYKTKNSQPIGLTK